MKILNERKAKSKTKSVKKRAQPPVKERYNTTKEEEIKTLVPVN